MTGIAVNQPGDVISQLGELLDADDGFKDAQLQRLAVSLQQLEEFCPRSIIRDIIHDNDLGHWLFASALSA